MDHRRIASREIVQLGQDPVPAAGRPPAGAPNIVLILLDEAGFGQFSLSGYGKCKVSGGSRQPGTTSCRSAARRQPAHERLAHGPAQPHSRPQNAGI